MLVRFAITATGLAVLSTAKSMLATPVLLSQTQSLCAAFAATECWSRTNSVKVLFRDALIAGCLLDISVVGVSLPSATEPIQFAGIAWSRLANHVTMATMLLAMGVVLHARSRWDSVVKAASARNPSARS